MKTVEIDDRLAGAAVQVRVVQGQEPAHFLAIFQGQLIIYQGGLSSSFDGKNLPTYTYTWVPETCSYVLSEM